MRALSSALTQSHLRDYSDLSVFVSMNEIAEFGGGKNKRFGGTFELQSCGCVFLRNPETELSYVLHAPAVTLDARHFLNTGKSLMAQGEWEVSLLSGGTSTDIINFLQRLVEEIGKGGAQVELREISYHPHTGSGVAYMMDSRGGEISRLSNSALLSKQSDYPESFGNEPGRINESNLFRYLNMPDRTPMIIAFDGSDYTGCGTPLVNEAARETARNLSEFEGEANPGALYEILAENGALKEYMSLDARNKEAVLGAAMCYISQERGGGFSASIDLR